MKAYLLRLTAATMLAALARRIAPACGAGKAATLGSGLLVLLVALGPLGQADLLEAVKTIAGVGYADVLTTQPVDKAANGLLEELITDSAEAYILDKISGMGVEADITVGVNALEGYPVPWDVKITGHFSQAEKTALAEVIRKELDIPEARQEWIIR